MINPYAPASELSWGEPTNSETRTVLSPSRILLWGYLGTSFSGGLFGLAGGFFGVIAGFVLAAFLGFVPFLFIGLVPIFRDSRSRLVVAAGVCGAITGASSWLLLADGREILTSLVTAAFGFAGGLLGAGLGALTVPHSRF